MTFFEIRLCSEKTKLLPLSKPKLIKMKNLFVQAHALRTICHLGISQKNPNTLITKVINISYSFLFV